MLDTVGRASGVRVLHIRSALKVFCAGADLAQIHSHFSSVDGPDRMKADIARFHGLFDRLETLPSVTLVEIGGAALGGGLEMALSCDLRIAAVEAKLGLPEARLGLVPGAGGTQRLTWLAGKGTASRLILSAEIIDGREAHQLGIVQWVVATDELAARAQMIAAAIAKLEPLALAASKSCIAAANEGDRNGFQEELAATRRLMESPATRARVAAFLDGARQKSD